jgi:hypothetical protein
MVSDVISDLPISNLRIPSRINYSPVSLEANEIKLNFSYREANWELLQICFVNNIVTCSTEGRRCYATLLSLLRNRGRTVQWIRSPFGIVALHGNQQCVGESRLPSNSGRMVPRIRSPLLYCCVHTGCIANNSGKASVGCYGNQQ